MENTRTQDYFNDDNDGQCATKCTPGSANCSPAGKKLSGGPEALAEVGPEIFRFIMEFHPDHLHAPDRWQPGTISQWDAFKDRQSVV